MTNHITGAVFSPWARPRDMFQAMARYQALKGFKPVGPHRSLADSLLSNVTDTCTTCGGTGLHGTYGAMGWRICPVCHGLGEAYRISLDELQALRQQVLDRYPDAAPPGWTPTEPIACPIQELATGLMLDACPRTSSDPVQEELFADADGAAGAPFLPWGMCVKEVPQPQPAPRPPAQPRITWLGLLALAKRLCRGLGVLH